ncbi:fungal-specific transcription factor domain-containing protein [Hypoxylon trugodes]|uniref:fungal-specific transcription factor domain-containing protein n=1 Tax=Hypoxylon trugodes TaxID=326681 RepID=UPI0021A0C569|nr:fungal-specific transcription factor domain-containing protein [Hypoxylon trugodes]KAI1385981.1 fungal-specific transcription factor domain-containing protein [Hypoxylon trugodes]
MMRKRHCWECRRRCLVCDATEPACNRCSMSGTECPGYGDVKPTRLKWLAPGKVNSRGRKRKGTPPSELRGYHNDDASKATPESVYTMMSSAHMNMPRLEIRNEACILAQAAEYFNSCIYRDLLPIQELGQNPHIFPLSATHLQLATRRPFYLQFAMVCVTLSHRINRIRSDPHHKALLEEFYSYWGLALRSLNEHLNAGGGCADDMVIAGILTLLLADVQQGSSLNWRCHLEGLHQMIALRGGFREVTKSKNLEPLLLCLWFITVIGNTTCPTSDLVMTGLYLNKLRFLLEQYSTAASPFQMCPLPLFSEIVQINHLRMQATEYGATKAEDLSTTAYLILERIHIFSPEQWAESKQFSKLDWILIGTTYRAAVALYCILSLQSLSVLPESSELRACCAEHSHFLQESLKEGLSSPRIKRFMAWPLVLLGVEAVHDSAATRAFIAKQLAELSYGVGTYVPLAAKRVLELFWNSGEKRWDACFDKPYIFTTQIAVDTSHLMPP